MAVIGGSHLAHPAHLQNNFCNGLVQPSLILNHHVDCQEDIHPILATNISKLKLRSDQFASCKQGWKIKFLCVTEIECHS